MPRWLFLLLTPLLPALAAAADPAVVTTDHVRAELVAHAPDGVAPGREVRLGLKIAHQPHWHTYWSNPGDSGLATTLAWTLPAGVTAGPVDWPTPRPLPFGPLMNHGYEGEVLLPVKVTVPEGFAAPALDIALKADWLVCKDVCIPESGSFRVSLPAAPPTTAHAALFADTLARVPAPSDRAKATGQVSPDGLELVVDGLPADWRGRPVRVFPELNSITDPAAPVVQRWDGERWVTRLPLSPYRTEGPATLDLVLNPDGNARGLRVSASVAGDWPAPGSTPVPEIAPASPPPPPAAPATSVLPAMALALLGGLLLNLMPCVFPILSLKVLGFARSGASRRALAVQGVAYTVGVVASFVGLAALLLVLRAGGEGLGWGFQLQSPWFVAALAIVFTLIGLNLAGVFEVSLLLPGRLATAQAKHPVVDHLLTGVLAVAVASPCTAPFMGVALGAALTLPVGEALAVFAALGFGMALPFLAAAVVPQVATWLPRPGVWMARFKVLMAFPMFATVVWLLWVLALQVGIDGAVGVLALLVAVAFAAWAFGAPGFGPRARAGFGAVAAAVLAATAVWAWPGLRAVPEAAVASAPAGWAPWSPEAVRQSLAEGRPVFVDFTAAWCVTCQFNKRTALADAEVLARMQQRGVRLMRADWTRRDPTITQELARLGRSGVPVYALHAGAGVPPRLLPEVLTADQVLSALDTLPSAAATGGTTSARSP